MALDLRLYVEAEIAQVLSRLRKMQMALLDLAEKRIDVVMPGYTHLQRAQPITFAHYLLAQIEAFSATPSVCVIVSFERRFSHLDLARSLDQQSSSTANVSRANLVFRE